MEFTVIIEQDEAGWYLGSIPALRGCRTQAKTLKQLEKRLQEVATLCLEEEKPVEKRSFIGVQTLRIPAHA